MQIQNIEPWSMYILQIQNIEPWSKYILQIQNIKPWSTYTLQIQNIEPWSTYILKIQNIKPWSTYLMHIWNIERIEPQSILQIQNIERWSIYGRTRRSVVNLGTKLWCPPVEVTQFWSPRNGFSARCRFCKTNKKKISMTPNSNLNHFQQLLFYTIPTPLDQYDLF